MKNTIIKPLLMLACAFVINCSVMQTLTMAQELACWFVPGLHPAP